MSTGPLVASELPAIRSFLTFQGRYPTSAITSITTAAIPDYLGNLAMLSSSYPAVVNPTWQGWYTQLFALLSSTTDLAQIQQLQQFSDWTAGSPCVTCQSQYPDCVSWDTWVSYWNAFRHGYRWSTNEWGTDAHYYAQPGQSAPGAPPAWTSAVQGVITSWGDAPPATSVNVGTDIGNNQTVVTAAQTTLQDWSAFTSIVGQTTAIGTSQHTLLTTLLPVPTLAAADYFLLLHLLIALGGGDAATQQLAQRVVSAPAGSVEYPNDILVNQLVYLSLLYLADPAGSYGWDNATMQSWIQVTSAAIVGSDPVSVAITGSLAAHAKVLHSDSAYPMQDPYAPSIGFSQRCSDTLFALDKARAGLGS